MKIELSQKNYQISDLMNSVDWEPSCSMPIERVTDTDTYIYICVCVPELTVAFHSFTKARQVILLSRLSVAADGVCSLEAA